MADEIKTVEQAIAFLEENEDMVVLFKVPDDLRTPEVCRAAIESCGENLQYVPEKLRTLELCVKAVRNGELALLYVPKTLRAKVEAEAAKPEPAKNAPKTKAASKEDEEKKWLKKIGGSEFSLLKKGDIPASVLTPDFCLKAVKKNGGFLRLVPASVITEELCLAASKSGARIQDIPAKYQTIKVCLNTIKTTTFFDYYKEKFIAEAYAQYPEKVRSTVDFMAAFLKNIVEGQHAGYREKAEEYLKQIPKEAKDEVKAKAGYTSLSAEEKKWLKKVEKDGKELANAPDDAKTAEVCLAAVRKSPSALQFVPEKERTEGICRAAVLNLGGDAALQYVPEKLKTAELCLQAVSRNQGNALQWVPEKLKTVELCKAAVSQTPFPDELEAYIPKAIRKKVLGN